MPGANVIRRTGGLEAEDRQGVRQVRVIRRTGGLEDAAPVGMDSRPVIRRTGGLEAFISWCNLRGCVIRRTGGLEEIGQPVARHNHLGEADCACPPCSMQKPVSGSMQMKIMIRM